MREQPVCVCVCVYIYIHIDHEKTVALVRDLSTAKGYYKRALALQPSRADATLGYCALLQEVGGDPAEIRLLYKQVIAGSMSHRTLVPTQ